MHTTALRALRTRLALAALAAIPLACARDDAEVDDSLIHRVERGDLFVTVRERGEIVAARDTRVSSMLEGRATLIELVPEGTVVAAGDEVAELDVSGIVEKRAVQAIAVVKAEAAFEQARKTVEIVDKELRAEERTAETRLEIARLRVEKFIGQKAGETSREGRAEPAPGTNAEMVARLRELLDDDAVASASGAARGALLERVLEILGDEANLELEMGAMANLIFQQIDEISLARADLELAAETLFYSRELEKKGFITSNELERDDINHKRALSKQTVACNNLLLLVNYTLPESLLELELELENADLGLESVRATGDARRVRERAELASVDAEYRLAKEQLETWDRQIQNGILRAPAPGLVVYGRFDWDEPVYEGMEVRERQEVIILPDITTMMAELKVPESQVGKLAPGQRAAIQIDAFPSLAFTGRVTHVSTLPDPSPQTQALKVYVTRVLIDGDNGEGTLRPGMNATVTIEVGVVRDVVNVPLPALDRRGDAHYVWKLTPDGPQAVEVELGANDLTRVEVVAGLSAGERIYLVRPPGSELPAEEAEPEAAPSTELEVQSARGEPAGATSAAASSGSR